MAGEDVTQQSSRGFFPGCFVVYCICNVPIPGRQVIANKEHTAPLLMPFWCFYYWKSLSHTKRPQF
jgi:hypothetical protein